MYSKGCGLVNEPKLLDAESQRGTERRRGLRLSLPREAYRPLFSSASLPVLCDAASLVCTYSSLGFDRCGIARHHHAMNVARVVDARVRQTKMIGADQERVELVAARRSVCANLIVE